MKHLSIRWRNCRIKCKFFCNYNTWEYMFFQIDCSFIFIVNAKPQLLLRCVTLFGLFSNHLLYFVSQDINKHRHRMLLNADRNVKAKALWQLRSGRSHCRYEIVNCIFKKVMKSLKNTKTHLDTSKVHFGVSTLIFNGKEGRCLDVEHYA